MNEQIAESLVACEDCHHDHYDIANNWFVDCPLCRCSRAEDPDRKR